MNRSLVIDASAAVPLLLSGAIPEELRAYELVAPPLLWSETTSTIRQLLVRGDLSSELARATMSRLSQSTIRRSCPDDLYAEALAVAMSLGWAKTYDAEYVALARLLDAPILTRDARLQRGSQRLVRFVDPTQL